MTTATTTSSAVAVAAALPVFQILPYMLHIHQLI